MRLLLSHPVAVPVIVPLQPDLELEDELQIHLDDLQHVDYRQGDIDIRLEIDIESIQCIERDR